MTCNVTMGVCISCSNARCSGTPLSSYRGNRTIYSKAEVFGIGQRANGTLFAWSDSTGRRTLLDGDDEMTSSRTGVSSGRYQLEKDPKVFANRGAISSKLFVPPIEIPPRRVHNLVKKQRQPLLRQETQTQLGPIGFPQVDNPQRKDESGKYRSLCTTPVLRKAAAFAASHRNYLGAKQRKRRRMETPPDQSSSPNCVTRENLAVFNSCAYHRPPAFRIYAWLQETRPPSPNY